MHISASFASLRDYKLITMVGAYAITLTSNWHHGSWTKFRMTLGGSGWRWAVPD